jgi:quinol monooxygenase YgiN
MFTFHVFIHVKAERLQEFLALTVDNASHTLEEPGALRFDVLQQQDDPTRIVFVESYRNAAAHAAHKETAHYQRWKASADEMMAETRKSVRYTQVFPLDK